MSSFVANGHAVLLHVYETAANVPEGVTLATRAKCCRASVCSGTPQSGSFAMFADWLPLSTAARARRLVGRHRRGVPAAVRFREQRNLRRGRTSGVINNAVLGLPQGPSRWRNGWTIAAITRSLAAVRLDERCAGASCVRRWLPGDSRAHHAVGRNRSGGIDGGSPPSATARAHALPFWHFYPIHYLNWHTVFDSQPARQPDLGRRELRPASVERDGSPQPRLRQEWALPAGLAVRTFVRPLSSPAIAERQRARR